MFCISSLLKTLSSSSIATVAINMRPVKGPWGGSSVFVQQFSDALRQSGFRVCYDLWRQVDVILIIDPRDDLQSKAFGMAEIRSYKFRYPEVKIIHRINECDKRKNSSFIDELLREANTLADYTVFISEWLLEYFSSLWFDIRRPHCVIYNGADSRIFHPVGGTVYKEDQTLRIVTHHWADNPMKGFPVYAQLDRMIASGQVGNAELWIIGRWPKDIEWQAALLFQPAAGEKLAGLLRQCHLYITASLWEPCGMHHVEGAQCGLPLLAHADGGGIVEAAERYGLIFKNDLPECIAKARAEYSTLRDKIFTSMPNGIVMAYQYVRIVQMLIAQPRPRRGTDGP